ncbi:MAG: transglutaminase domain-containing protein [Candidatus Altiarchaeota archaeon]|nr:transglutaminase domain-containing protein [Candidatus Altiarchaeota archaeon]
MDYNRISWIIFITAVLFLQGCVELPFQGNRETTTTQPTPDVTATTRTETTTIPGTTTLPEKTPPAEMPPVLSYALLNYDYYQYDDPTIRSHAESITEGCMDDECRLLKIHKYVIDNMYYEKYKNRSHGMPGLFNKGYGMCGDFAVFYYNYLKSIGLETYIAIIPEHTYAVSCNHNLTRLQSYIEDDPDFKEYTNEYIFPNFEFEVNPAFKKTCLRIEGPSSTKGAYRYPGEHYEDTKITTGESFFLDPETWVWEPFSESEITIEKPRAHIERLFRFLMDEESDIAWRVKKMSKRVGGGLDYEFEAYDITTTLSYQYATFTLPEMDRFDRVRIHITIQAANPILFYTLQDKNQLENFKYYVEHRYILYKDDLWRYDEKPKTGLHDYEFDYISSCGAEEGITSFDRECIITDAGRRMFAIHNEVFFEENEVNITVKYLEFL